MIWKGFISCEEVCTQYKESNEDGFVRIERVWLEKS